MLGEIRDFPGEREFPKITFDYSVRRAHSNRSYGTYFKSDEEDFRVVNLLKKRLADTEGLAAKIAVIRVEYWLSSKKQPPDTVFRIILSRQESGVAKTDEFDLLVSWHREEKTVCFTQDQHRPDSVNNNFFPLHETPIYLQKGSAKELVDLIMCGILAALNKIHSDTRDLIKKIYNPADIQKIISPAKAD